MFRPTATTLCQKQHVKIELEALTHNNFATFKGIRNDLKVRMTVLIKSEIHLMAISHVCTPEKWMDTLR